MTPYTDAHWSRFFQEVGRPDLASDLRFIGIANRTRHIGELLEIAAGYIAAGSTEQWVSTCDRLEIPAASVAEIGRLIDDPHLVETDFFQYVDDKAMGRVRFAGVPVRFDGERASVSMPPRLGQDTRAVLQEAGLSAADIDALAPRNLQ